MYNSICSAKSITNQVVAYMGLVFETRAFSFSTNTVPNPFAFRFMDFLKENGVINFQSPRIAVLGSGNGRDALFFANNGYDVISFEVVESARDITAKKFRSNSLEHRLTQYTDFMDAGNIDPASLDGVYSCSALQHLAPEQLLEVFNLYRMRLKEDGLMAVALENRGTFLYRAIDETDDVPKRIADLRRIVYTDGVEDVQVHGYVHDSQRDGISNSPGIPLMRWYYTQEQLEIIALASRFKILESLPWVVNGYTVAGQQDIFNFLILKPDKNRSLN